MPQGLDTSASSPLFQSGWGFYLDRLRDAGALPSQATQDAQDLAALTNAQEASKLPYQKDQERQQSQMTDADTAGQIDAGVGSQMAARALTRAMAQKTGMAQADADAFFLPGQDMKRRAETEDFLARQQPKIDLENNKDIAAQIIQQLKNQGAANTATITTTGRQNAGDSAAAIGALGHIEGSGFGGRPEAAPIVSKLQGIVDGRTGQTPGIGTYTPDIEAKIANAVKNGFTRQQAIDRLTAVGVIKK